MIASVLNLDRAAMRRLKVTDPYSIHRVVYSLFSRDTDQRILYADQGGNSLSRRILVLSEHKPLKSDGDIRLDISSREVPTEFLEHIHYQFKVVVNPTKRNRKSGKREPIVGQANLVTWFEKKASSKWGFKVNEQAVQVESSEVVSFEGKDSAAITLNRVTFSGTLAVSEPDKFKKSFTSGIGSGKAFGCGLLQIVPIVELIF